MSTASSGSPPLQRRLVIAGAAALALLPMREAVAQAAASRADWFTMVQMHHALIAKSFEELLASGPSGNYLKRDMLIRTIGYQLTAHSVAEENAIYPALALNGMTAESDKLYLDQSHAKVLNTRLEMTAMANREGRDWLVPARELYAAVLKHAKEDEEGRLYPQLRAKLDSGGNAMVGALYQREFASVKAPPTVA